jgi:hypothetical protein
MHNFPRPATATVEVPRVTVPGNCSACGANELAAYRVMSEGGWWNVVKCQACLTALSRERGPLFGAFTPLGARR